MLLMEGAAGRWGEDLEIGLGTRQGVKRQRHHGARRIRIGENVGHDSQRRIPGWLQDL
jgi:hypothetical protein